MKAFTAYIYSVNSRKTPPQLGQKETARVSHEGRVWLFLIFDITIIIISAQVPFTEVCRRKEVRDEKQDATVRPAIPIPRTAVATRGMNVQYGGLMLAAELAIDTQESLTTTAG